MAKATEERGKAASTLIVAIEEYNIELTRCLGEPLWTLAAEYTFLGVLRGNSALDLLHYASATRLGYTYPASWDKKHFNSKVGERVNRVNPSRGLTTLKVGDPVKIGRHLGIA